MRFYMPVLVYDEESCVQKHAKEFTSYGRKALIVTGARSAKINGSYDDVTAALNAYQKEYCLFDQVEENPSVETIRKAATFGLEQQCDFVIGIGGGSPLDAAKAIALLMKRGDLDSNLYDPKGTTEALPVVAIPTTCGTGSEVTGVSVLTQHDKKMKSSIPPRIYPEIALIDGKYLKTAPLSMIVNTSIDALCHMIESYINKKADDYNKLIVEGGLQVWARTKDVLTGEKEADANDYRNLMRSSAIAGIAIAQAGTSLPHALSYILTYDLKMPHGKACGYFLHSFLKEADHEIVSRLLKLAGFADLDEFGAYLEKCFGEIEVPEAVLERAFDVVIHAPARLAGVPFNVDEAVLKRVVWR